MLNTAGTALSLSNGTVAGTGFASTTSTGGTNNVTLAGVAGTLNLGTGALSNATGTNFNVNGGNANITFDGTITDDVGRLVEITSRTGGTIDFNGAISDGNDGDGDGILINNNTGGAVRFDGGLTLSTGTANAFTATNNGTTTSVTGMTIIVTDPAGTASNKITTTSGTALNVSNTTIGTGGLVFESISSNGGSSNGIILNTTGVTAGLTVTGTGTAGSGGTISNKTGIDGNFASQGTGIYLNNTVNVSLSYMQLNDFQNYAIRGKSVANVTLNHMVISGTSGTNSGTDGEGAVYFGGRDIGGSTIFNGVTGDLNITNSTIGGSYGRNVSVINTSGTLDFIATNNTFNATSGPGGDNLSVEARGTAQVDARVDTNQFKGSPGDQIEFVNQTGTPTMNVTVTNNTLTNTLATNIVGGGGVTFATNSSMVFNFSNNTVSGADGSALTIFKATDGTSMQGTVSGNTIGTSGVAGSGSKTGNGLFLSAGGAGVITLAVTNNTIQQYNGNAGIYADNIGGTYDVSFTITGNTIRQPGPNAFAGIALAAGAPGSSDDIDVFARIANNDVSTGDPNNSNDIIVGVSGSLSSITLSGATAADVDDVASIQAFLKNTNNLNGAAAGTAVTAYSDIDNAGTATVVEGFAASGATPPQPASPAQPMMLEAAPASSTSEEEPVDGGLVSNPQVVDDGGQTNTQYGDPVPADDGDAPIVVDDGVISQAELDLIVNAAIERWAAAGATPEQIAAMRAVKFSVEDLGGLMLGSSGAGVIKLDDDAGGWRWFIDATSGQDEEFSGSGTKLTAIDNTSQAGTRIDLLTVVMHELGHQIGLSDLSGADAVSELMYGTVGAGQRRLPGDDDAAQGGTTAVAGSATLDPIAVGTLQTYQSVTVTFRTTVDQPATNSTVAPVTGETTVTYDSAQTKTATSSNSVDSLTLGDRIFLDVNKDGDYDAGTDTGIDGVALTLFADTDNDGVLSAGDTQIATTTSANGGVYSFAGLAPGNYIVRIDATNFGSGGVLQHKVSLAGGNDPDTDTDDHDDNGIAALGGSVASHAIELAYGTETEAGPTGPALDTNNRLDFGFEQPNQPPVIANLNGNNVDFTENAGFVQVDAGGNVDITDSDSADFDRGSLTITLSGGQAGDEIRFNPASVQIDETTGATTVGGVVIGIRTAVAGGFKFDFDADATPDRVETLIKSLEYRSTSDNPSGTRTFTFTLVDGDGRVNGGDDDTTVTSTVTIVPVSDAPSGADNSKTIAEDGSHTFAAADFGFADPAESHAFAGVVITTLPTDGVLRLDGVAVTAGTFVSAADIAANKLVFRPDANENGTGYASFTFQVRDNGGTANSGQDTDQTPNTFTFDVTAVNDAPTAFVSSGSKASFDPTEQTALNLKEGVFTVSDVDAGTGTITATLSVDYGILNVSVGTSGATIISGNGTGAVVISGTVAQINALLSTDGTSSVTYTANTDAPPAEATLTLSVNDGGNSGSGGAQTASATEVITISAVNDAPALTAPTSAAIGYTENASPTALMQGVVLSDVDMPASFAGGSLTINVGGSEGGINFRAGSLFFVSSGRLVYNDNGTPRDLGAISLIGTTTVAVTGLTAEATLARLNDLIDDFVFVIVGDNPTGGDRTVTLTFNDGGNSGGGGALTAQRTQTLTVTAVNDAPVNAVPGVQNGTEDTNLVFSTANGNAITVSDAEAGTLTVTLSVNNGVLTLATISGLTFTSGDGTRDPSMTFSGTKAAINAALDGLVYRGNLNHQGSDTLTIVTDDGGESGTGGAKNDSDTVAITLADDGRIDGDSGDNVLTGAPGGDRFMLHHGGDDTAHGLGGRDIFYFGGAFAGADAVTGGDEFDVVVLQGNYSSLTFGSNVSTVEGISLQSGSITRWGQDGTASYDYNVTTENALVGMGTQFRINGQSLLAGEDLTFNGSAETDGGTFLVYAGYGKDTLTGGSGGDIFFFEAGRFGAGDTIDGGGGRDAVVISGYGPDPLNPLEVTFEAGSFISIEALSFNGRFATDPAARPSYDVVLKNGNIAAGETLIVNASSLSASQTLKFDGTAVADGKLTIFGGDGADTLRGGANADLVEGRGGGDVLTGGGGADIFFYRVTADSASGAGNFDTITDFVSGEDKIDLFRIDANTTASGNQAFAFIGSAAFAGTGAGSAGQLRVANVSGNIWEVQGDVDGNGTADFVLQVTVAAGQPLETDFVL